MPFIVWPVTVVDRWQRLVSRCRSVNVHVLVQRMSPRSRELARGGIVVLVVNHGLSLGERCEEVERRLFARHVAELPAAG